MMKPSTSGSSSDPKYKGVRKRKWGKYVSEIRLPNSRERIWLGSYDSAKKAARAFDAAQFSLRGLKGSFNFPENPPKITAARPMMTPQEIQIEAARYANEEVAGKGPDEEAQQSGNNVVAEQCTTSSTPSSVVSDGAVQGMDWSFLDLLDTLDGNVESDYGLYAGIGHDISGEYQPLPPSEPVDDGLDGQYGEETVFSSQPSFLWNF